MAAERLRNRHWGGAATARRRLLGAIDGAAIDQQQRQRHDSLADTGNEALDQRYECPHSVPPWSIRALEQSEQPLRRSVWERASILRGG